MTPGIYNIGIDEYHNGEGISRSGILEIKKSPLHFWDRYLNPDKEVKKTTKSMALGSMVHTLTLEPHLFDSQFIIGQKFGNSKVGKAKKVEFEAAAVGKTIVSQEEFDKAKKITTSIYDHDKAARIIDGARIESSIYWLDDDTKLLCKARPDIWNEPLNLVCDLKNTVDAAPNDFLYAVLSGGYHIQAAMIIDGIYTNIQTEINDYRFIAAPVERPFKPYIYYLPPDIIERGRQEYKDALKLAKACLDRGQWDLERNITIPLNFSQHQLNTNSFSQLMEIYQCKN